MEGSEEVSIACEQSPGCKRVGCEMKYDKKCGMPKCTDISRTNCAVRKKILDCVATRNMSPQDMDFLFDKTCGEKLLGQKTDSAFSQCNHGWRQMEPCNSDEDCPLAPSQFSKGAFASKSNPKLGTCCKITKDSKYMSLASRLGPGSCGRRQVVGCQAAVQQQCEDVGPYLPLAAMAV